MALEWTSIDDKAVNTVRALAADAVDKVGNGHPGTAISLAPAAHMLFHKIMRHQPSDPTWLGRDRFVLSAGHTSLTLYLQLFACGYGLEIEDIASFRTYGSATPGHPEFGHTAGVEATTGPLGQGIGNAVGMAMAARRERGLLDADAPAGESPFDHRVFVIASDGDLQEGISAEASSLAGHQELGNLIVLWDDNHISIEDDTDVAFSEDVLARYRAYGWHTERVDWSHEDDGYKEDVHALHGAFEAALAETSRPSIIALRTIIGWPSPTKQNTGAIHGSKLGAEETAALKKELGLDPEESFAVSEEVLQHLRGAATRGDALRAEWDSAFHEWQQSNPDRAALLTRLLSRELPEGWTNALPEFDHGTDMSTRAASGAVVSALADTLPELWGGSADLAGSNNTTMAGEPSFLPAHRSTEKFAGHEYGRTLHFGIREHAMGAIVNGMALHGLTRPYGGTFLVFSDYMRPSVRLAAMMHIPSIFVWTHDSIGVGEDGPTHQPIEHLTALRAIPGLSVVRPADATETAYAWRGALEQKDGPTALVLTRQNIPTFNRGPGQCASAENVLRGGYVLLDAEGTPDVVIIATGSEVQHAVGARDLLADEGIHARVVSMPCVEWFQRQDAAYRDSVIPPDVTARVSVEAGLSASWHAFVGSGGRFVSIEEYGASAAGALLMDKHGFTAESVAAHARDAHSEAS